MELNFSDLLFFIDGRFLLIVADNKSLWEVLVPRFSNAGVEYALDYHHAWDDRVREIAGGVTILRTAKGQWVNRQGKVLSEEMIPVRIHCTEHQIDEIIDYTLKYYDQEAVFAYEISSRVKVKERKKE